MSNPNQSCLNALRRLIRYLRGTIDLGIIYKCSDSKTLRLECYADSSWGGAEDVQCRSLSGYVCYFGGGPISWGSNLQTVIAQSSAEAELIAAFTASTAVVYHRSFLEELGEAQTGATVIWEDNTSCIAMSRNPVNHKRNRHIQLKYHYVRALNEDNTIRLEYCITTDMIADLLTKPLSRRLFEKLRDYLVLPV